MGDASCSPRMGKVEGMSSLTSGQSAHGVVVCKVGLPLMFVLGGYGLAFRLLHTLHPFGAPLSD